MSFVKSVADETFDFVNNGHVHVYKFPEGGSLCVADFAPNWSWENDLKPLVKTDSCQMEHCGYCSKGTMDITMNDGQVFTVNEGDVYHIKPGHTAHTDVSTVLVDFHPQGLPDTLQANP